MTFQPGDPKPPSSGRKLGQANKRTEFIRAGVKSAIETLRQGGLTPIEIMAESSRIIHAVARSRSTKRRSKDGQLVDTGQDVLTSLATLDPKELAMIVDMFCKASDIASKAAQYAYAKLAQIDYVGDAPSAAPIENKMVVVLKIGEGPPGARPMPAVIEPMMIDEDDERRELLEHE